MNPESIVSERNQIQTALYNMNLFIGNVQKGKSVGIEGKVIVAWGCYCPPHPLSCTKALTPGVTVFGHGAHEKVAQDKRGHQD